MPGEPAFATTVRGPLLGDFQQEADGKLGIRAKMSVRFHTLFYASPDELST